MSGRWLISGLLGFAVLFGIALWWFQTRAYYVRETVEGPRAVLIAGREVPAAGYDGIDASTSPLKLRGCFRLAAPLDGPPADKPEPPVSPGWFDCFDAESLDADLKTGAAAAVLAEFNAPYGFDRVVAAYPDGRAFEWRQINKCGDAFFEGDPVPEGCPKPASE